MTLANFLTQIGSNTNLDFEHSIQIIADNYLYTPVAFSNGDLHNTAGSNEGSCKIFAFAKQHNLSEAQTLVCFGRFYQDVLATPNGNDHGNIRNFMKHGWKGIKFEQAALTAK